MSIDSFANYPICDTDVWVNLCLGEIIEDFFKLHKKICVADVVAGEILRWHSSNTYNKIAKEFERYQQKGSILVINHEEDIPEIVRLAMQAQLYQIGFANDFKNKPPEDNKGEIVSAIYAEYFNIPFMKSNDKSFEDGLGKREFPELIVKNWNETLRDVISDNQRRIKLQAKVESESRKMSDAKKQYQQQRQQQVTGLSFEEKLEKLLEKYSK